MERGHPAIRIDDETELRPPREVDAQEVWDAILANADRFEPFFDWLDTLKSVEDELSFIKGRLSEMEAGKAVQFFIWRGDRFVGSLGTVVMSRLHDNAEIGYFVTREVEGTSLAHQAVSALIDHLVEDRGLHRIWVRIVPENRRSITLARRLGFTFEGTLRDGLKLRGQYMDIDVYSLLAPEWRRRRGTA